MIYRRRRNMKHSPWTAWLFLGLLAAAAIVCCCHRCFALICSSTTTTTTTASRSSSRTVKHSNYHYLSSIKATNGIDTTRPYVTSKFKFFPLQLSDSNNNDSNSMLQEATRLREKARKLKEDVQARQTEKDLQTQQTKIDLERTQEEKRERESRYSAKLPILKSDGSTQLETVYFTPRFPSSMSKIISFQAYLPLGLILGEHEEIAGAIGIDQVDPEGNGRAAGIQVGDVLRAVTACQVTMEAPTWQLLAGGIGQPKTKRLMFTTDGVTLEQAIQAISSNRMDPEQRPMWLVLERLVENDNRI